MQRAILIRKRQRLNAPVRLVIVNRTVLDIDLNAECQGDLIEHVDMKLTTKLQCLEGRVFQCSLSALSSTSGAVRQQHRQGDIKRSRHHSRKRRASREIDTSTGLRNRLNVLTSPNRGSATDTHASHARRHCLLLLSVHRLRFESQARQGLLHHARNFQMLLVSLSIIQRTHKVRLAIMLST